MDSIRALDLICLDVLQRYWHATSKGRGGRVIDGTPWTKVSAKDMVGYLAAKGLKNVSEKTAQRSLRRLVEAGLCRREQLGKKQWNHESWYAPPGGHTEVDQEDQQEAGPVAQSDQGSPDEVDTSSPSEENSEEPSINCSSSYPSSYPSFCPSEEDREECSDEQGNPEETDFRRTDDGRPTVSFVMTVPRPTRNVQEILRRCQERGGTEAAWSAPKEPKKVVVDGKVKVVDDGATSPLR